MSLSKICRSCFVFALVTPAVVLGSCKQSSAPIASLHPARPSLQTVQEELRQQLAYRSLKTQLENQTSSLRRQQASVVDTKPIQNLDDPRVAVVPPVRQISPSRSSGPLAKFHTKLAALDAGAAIRPVTILHIGDSHVASDSFSRGIRENLQKRYGDAGRGTTIPAAAFRYGVAAGMAFSSSGPWQSKTARKKNSGPFGLSGVRVTSRSSRARLSMTSQNGSFDWVAVTVLTGPSQGSFTLSAGGVSQRFDAYAKKRGSKRFLIEAKARKAIVRPGGGARTSVLSWSSGKNRPGIRYVNFGLIGATVGVTRRLDAKLVKADIARLKPDLIVYGYGTNEGFNDRLDLKSHRKDANRFIDLVTSAAPDAEWVFIGAASGLRKRGRRVCGNWALPPKLEPVRISTREIARERQAAYWDWSKAMGGDCAINDWAQKKFAAKDRVHLTMKGYRASAKSFSDWLTQPEPPVRQIALN